MYVKAVQFAVCSQARRQTSRVDGRIPPTLARSQPLIATIGLLDQKKESGRSRRVSSCLNKLFTPGFEFDAAQLLSTHASRVTLKARQPVAILQRRLQKPMESSTAAPSKSNGWIASMSHPCTKGATDSHHTSMKCFTRFRGPHRVYFFVGKSRPFDPPVVTPSRLIGLFVHNEAPHRGFICGRTRRTILEMTGGDGLVVSEAATRF